MRWWKWNEGSSIFFWRWPRWYQDKAREGHPPMFIGPTPTSKTPQPHITDESIRKKVREKVEKVMKHGYIEL